MKFIDCHVHMGGAPVKAEDFIKALDVAGVDAAEVLSYAPESQIFAWQPTDETPRKPVDRLNNLKEYMAYRDRVYTMFWLDPMEKDALEQVDRAVDAGVDGFKVICDYYYPCDERPMEVFAHIAEVGKPLHFHTGIQWTTMASSKYNRPAWFESLIEIPKLRFALAHCSWPWMDECIAVYGHWRYMREHNFASSEMFVETTPGPMPMYREELLTKLFRVFGDDTADNIMLGTDCSTRYNGDYCKQILEGENFLLRKLAVSEERKEKYFWKNYHRFIGR